MNYRSFDPKTSTRRNFKRLPSYDYRSSGAYFVTICTEKRQRVLEIPIIRTEMVEKWHHLPQRFPGVRLDTFVLMPDHVHGILRNRDTKRQKEQEQAGTAGDHKGPPFPAPPPSPLRNPGLGLRLVRIAADKSAVGAVNRPLQ